MLFSKPTGKNKEGEGFDLLRFQKDFCHQSRHPVGLGLFAGLRLTNQNISRWPK